MNVGFKRDAQKRIWGQMFEIFDYDIPNTMAWFQAPNPWLQNRAPIDLCSGDLDQLGVFVKDSAEAAKKAMANL